VTLWPPRPITRRATAALAAAPLLASNGPARANPAGSGRLIDLPGEYGRRLRAARVRAFHLHNQPTGSTLHEALTGLWDSVFERTGGDLMVTVLPLNANLPADDAEAVDNVATGRFEFVSVAAPILDRLVPDIALQSLPFVYRSTSDALALIDQPAFTRLMTRDLAPYGLSYLEGGTFSNGMRVIASVASKPLRTLDDLRGLRIRVPPSEDITLLFRSLGAEPVTTTIAQIREAFVAGTIEAEENPPSVIPAFDLQSVAHWINLTHHLWTGFNTLANRAFWTSLPPAAREAVMALLPDFRARQVARQEASNRTVVKDLQAAHGMEVQVTDTSGARARMKPVYEFMYRRFSSEARRLADPLLHAAVPG
jgi:tripartite ATP-independent transporter DctP family solute receptor